MFRVQELPSVDQNVCTAIEYPLLFVEQRVYACLTCELEYNAGSTAGGVGICEGCARVCHAGHELRFMHADEPWTCDCFTGEIKAECKLVPKPSADYTPVEVDRDAFCTLSQDGTRANAQLVRRCTHPDCISEDVYLCVACARDCHQEHADSLEAPQRIAIACSCFREGENISPEHKTHICQHSDPGLLPKLRTSGPFIHLLQKLRPYIGLRQFSLDVLQSMVTPSLDWAPFPDGMYLNLRFNSLQPTAAKVICDMIASNKSFHTIAVRRNHMGGCGEMLAEALNANTTLRQLDIGGTRLTAPDLISVLKAATKHPTLATLDLCYMSLDAVADELVELVKTNKTLTTLFLNAMQVRTMNMFSSALRDNSTLTMLSMNDHEIGVEGLELLCKALRTNSSIKHLSVSDIAKRAGVPGAKAVGKMLARNKTIERLYMSGCGIGPDGCTYIIRAFEFNKSLRFLGLASNNLGNNGALQFLNLLRHPCSLHHIVLKDNGITQMDLASLVLAPTANHYQANYKTIELDLSCNLGLQTPPASVCVSPSALVKYLGDLRLGATPLRRVKVMMVGHGGVGKTTLSKSMLLQKQLYKPDLTKWDNDTLVAWLEDMSFSDTVKSAFKYSAGTALSSEPEFLQVLKEGQIPNDEEKYLRAQVKRLRSDCKRAIAHGQLLYVSTRGIRMGKMELLKSGIEVTRLTEETKTDGGNGENSDGEEELDLMPGLDRGPSIAPLEQVEVTVVDLAGQLEYLLSHAVFFRSIYAIYILCSNLTHHPLQRAHNLIDNNGVESYATEEYRENKEWKQLVLLWLDTLRSLLGGSVPVQVALTFADTFVEKLQGYNHRHLEEREQVLRSHLLESYPSWFSHWRTSEDKFVHSVDASNSNQEHHLYKAICRATLELCNRVIVPDAYEAARDAVTKLITTRQTEHKLMIVPQDEILHVLCLANENLAKDKGVLMRAYRYLVDSLELLEVELGDDDIVNVLDPLNWLAMVMSNFISDPGHHPLIAHVPNQPGIYDWDTMKHQLATICGIPFSAASKDDLQLVMKVLCKLGVCFRSTSDEDAAAYGFKQEAYIFPSSMRHWPTGRVTQIWTSALDGFKGRKTVLGRRVAARRKDQGEAFLPMGLAALFQNELRCWPRYKNTRMDFGQGCWFVHTETEAVLMHSDRNHTWINLYICAKESDDCRKILSEALGLLDGVLSKMRRPRLQLYAVHPACLHTLHEAPTTIPLSRMDLSDNKYDLSDSDDEEDEAAAVLPDSKDDIKAELMQSDEEWESEDDDEDLLAELHALRNRSVTHHGLEVELRPEDYTKHTDAENLEHIRTIDPNQQIKKQRAPLMKRWGLSEDQVAQLYVCQDASCTNHAVEGLECMWGYFPEVRWEENGKPQPPVGSFDREESKSSLDIFLSHRGPDTKACIARPAAYILKRLGFVCFFDQDPSSMKPMLKNASQMAQALWGATMTVVIISPHFHESKWCCKELNTALRRQQVEDKPSILPVYFGVDFNAKETRERYGMIHSTSSALCPPDLLLRRTLIEIILQHILVGVLVRDPEGASAKLEKFIANGKLDTQKLFPVLESLLDDYLADPPPLASLDGLLDLAKGSSKYSSDDIRANHTRVVAQAKRDSTSAAPPSKDTAPAADEPEMKTARVQSSCCNLQ